MSFVAVRGWIFGVLKYLLGQTPDPTAAPGACLGCRATTTIWRSALTSGTARHRAPPPGDPPRLVPHRRHLLSCLTCPPCPTPPSSCPTALSAPAAPTSPHLNPASPLTHVTERAMCIFEHVRVAIILSRQIICPGRSNFFRSRLLVGPLDNRHHSWMILEIHRVNKQQDGDTSYKFCMRHTKYRNTEMA